MTSFVRNIPSHDEILAADPAGKLIGELWYQDRRGGKYRVALWLHEKGFGRLFRLENALMPVETYTCPYKAMNALFYAHREWIESPDHFLVDNEILHRV